MYSALGKIFSPLPLLRPDGQIATLFDHLYVTLSGLPGRLEPGMLVLAGDVFLLFDHREVTAPPPGVTAISMRVDTELGRGHGVFVTGDAGRISKTLQKVSVKEMRAAGAADAAGRVLIDTGLLFFDPDRVRTLDSLSRALRAKTEVDLYDDMTAALALGTDGRSYLDGGRSRPVRRRLWRDLHGVPFKVAEVAGEFLHLGTTRQFRDAMVGRNPSPAAALFQQNVLAHGELRMPKGARVYQSVLLKGPQSSARERGRLGAGSVIEHSILSAGCRIGRGSVVSQTEARLPIDLGPNLLLFQVPLRDDGAPGRTAQVVCGVEDDFKGRLAEGRCTYLNQPIEKWLTHHGIVDAEIWEGVKPEERALWNARVFVVTPTRPVNPVALRIAAPIPADNDVLRAWRTTPRFSMADILAAVEPRRLIEHREAVSAHLQMLEVDSIILNEVDRPADSAIGHFATHAAYAVCERALLTPGSRWPHGSDVRMAPSHWLMAARASWTAAQLCRRPDRPPFSVSRGDPPLSLKDLAERYTQGAFECVAIASDTGRSVSLLGRPHHEPRPALVPGWAAVASSPARLDLAGGWSDTPPYCFDRGGHVVNVGIDLDGRPPVSASVTTTTEPILILESHDLGRRIELRDWNPAVPLDVGDPFALHKVALQMVGLLPDKPGALRRFLRGVGAGLHVTTEARVPKGSGLGTSSILGATLLAALQAAAGWKRSQRQIIDQTLLLEQRLGTGGGWQDQVGGVAPGIKSTVSGPGIPQKPKVEVLKLSGARLAALEERLVVYYSGQQRLARDILRRVMGRWLGREPAVVGLMNDLKQSAAALRAALLRSDWNRAAEQINRYWQIKKELYPGSSTPATDRLFLETRGDYLAAGLAGAGGGGFAYFLCKNARQAARLRETLAERSAEPGSMGSVYSTRINREGLRVRRRRLRDPLAG
jgi:fucokinase